MAEPVVIASHLDIVYRVYGAKKVNETPDVPSFVKQLLGHRKDDEATPGIGRRVHAVKDVSFVVNSGESVGIIGRNGSGKSTMLRAVAGLITPSGGSVWVKGRPALLGVNAVMMSTLTGERNVMLGGLAAGLSRREVKAKMADIVEFSGIGEFVNLPMSALSSGMAARLRFAISTVTVPDVLMIDEALATGDADFQERSRTRIQEIRQAAGTVFLVSHSSKTILDTCDRALWMEKGHLVMDGPAEEVVQAYNASVKSGKVPPPLYPQDA